MTEKARIKPDVVKIAKTQRHLYLLQKVKAAKNLTSNEIDELERFEMKSNTKNKGKSKKVGKLTAQQELFCREYCVDFNASQAAIRAKYSKKSARATAARLLTKENVQRKIQELQKETAKKIDITVQNVLEELAKLAFSNLPAMLKQQGDSFALKDLGDLADDQKAAISEITETENNRGRKVKFKLYDKPKALELLGRHLGMFTDNINIKEMPTVNIILEGEKE